MQSRKHEELANSFERENKICIYSSKLLQVVTKIISHKFLYTQKIGAKNWRPNCITNSQNLQPINETVRFPFFFFLAILYSQLLLLLSFCISLLLLSFCSSCCWTPISSSTLPLKSSVLNSVT